MLRLRPFAGLDKFATDDEQARATARARRQGYQACSMVCVVSEAHDWGHLLLCSGSQVDNNVRGALFISLHT